jgi:hypothetical protein
MHGPSGADTAVLVVALLLGSVVWLLSASCRLGHDEGQVQEATDG